MTLEQMRLDCALKQKKGVHFILASILIWGAVTIIHSSSLDIMTKNLLTFCTTAPLMPLAFLISKFIHVDFTNKGNPLTNLGILFSVNQMLYLLIAMWVYPTVPEKMVMVLAIIFGAHLMPFGWLYKSKSYMVLSVVIPMVTLIAGITYPAFVVGIIMILFEILFCVLLMIEVRGLQKSKTINV
jgi:hypothetical protein